MALQLSTTYGETMGRWWNTRIAGLVVAFGSVLTVEAITVREKRESLGGLI